MESEAATSVILVVWMLALVIRLGIRIIELPSPGFRANQKAGRALFRQKIKIAVAGVAASIMGGLVIFLLYHLLPYQDKPAMITTLMLTGTATAGILWLLTTWTLH